MLEARASVLMELIIDKLSLLNYEDRFCKSRDPRWPSLHKFYFVLPCSSRTEQFLYFVNLVSWLLSLNGRKFVMPQELTNSNAVCMDIMQHLKELGVAQPDWAPAKLKQGFGDSVCSVLDSLTDLALEAEGFCFNQPIYSQDEQRHECVGTNTVNDETDKIGTLGDAIPMKLQGTAGCTLEKKVNPKVSLNDCLEKSRSEAECAAFELHISMGSDGRDWRTHLNEAQRLYSGFPSLSEAFSWLSVVVVTRNCMERIEDDISFFLDKLESRENFLNKQLETQVIDYKVVNDQLMEVQQRHEQSSTNLRNLSHELERTSQQLDEVKHNLVEKGNQISDISPLVDIKNRIHVMKVELKEMGVRVGVLEYTLLKNQLNQRIGVESSKDIILV